MLDAVEFKTSLKISRNAMRFRISSSSSVLLTQDVIVVAFAVVSRNHKPVEFGDDSPLSAASMNDAVI